MRFDEEKIMRQWDVWRKKIANGDKSSAPRDWFESLLDQWMEPFCPWCKSKLFVADDSSGCCLNGDCDFEWLAKEINRRH